MHDIPTKNAVNLLVDGLCGIELRFGGHSFLLFRRLTRLPYHLFAAHHRPGPQAGQGKLAAMDAQSGKALADRHHFNGVDVDVFRQRRHPPDRLGDVFRG